VFFLDLARICALSWRQIWQKARNTIMQTSPSLTRPTLLRTVLRLNGATSAGAGLAALAASGPLSALTGLAPALLLGAGAIALAYGAALLWLAPRDATLRAVGSAAVPLDLFWVIASIAVLLTAWPSLTVAGRWMVAAQADLVLTWAILQLVGVRRLR
jgi:hypothetical protein